MGLLALILAAGVAFPSQAAVSGLSTALAVPILLLIILIGVVFDIIGVAAAVVDDAPLNAMATRRRPGAQQAIYLARNADAVSAFCSDVVGDIAGTIAGGAALAASVRLLALGPPLADVGSALALALVAALTVGGKAAGKGLALGHSVSVIVSVGRIIGAVENTLHLRILPEERSVRSRRR